MPIKPLIFYQISPLCLFLVLLWGYSGCASPPPAALPETQEVGNQPDSVFIDPRDEEAYRLIRIGDDIWMSENLRYKTFKSSLAPGDAKEAGLLYFFEEACFVCPPGWHLSTLKEWLDLEVELGFPQERIHIPSSIFEREPSEYMKQRESIEKTCKIGAKLKKKEGWGDDEIADTSVGFDAVFAPSVFYTKIRYNFTTYNDKRYDYDGKHETVLDDVFFITAGGSMYVLKKNDSSLHLIPTNYPHHGYKTSVRCVKNRKK